jgi:DNA topoisomerase-6 subunit A
VVVAAEKRRDPHVDIPSRTLSNVRYSPRKRILEMGSATNRRQLFDLSQAKSYMRTMLVASGCKTLLTRDKTTSLRGMFYMLKHTIEGTKKTRSTTRRMRHGDRRRQSARACGSHLLDERTRWSATHYSTAATNRLFAWAPELYSVNRQPG